MFYSKWYLYSKVYLKWVRKRKLEKYLLQIKNGEKPLFIHINKTAGSSIANSLGITEAHYTLRDYELAYKKLFKEELPLSTDIWVSLRNPFDKVVSQYFFRCQHNQNSLKENPLSFDDWVKEAYEIKEPFYRDREIMFLPQHYWLSSDRKYHFNYILFENLEKDYELLARKYHGNRLVWKKKSSHGMYREYYSDNSRKIIEKAFELDLINFKYTF